MGGAGMVHPSVLKNMNINPEQYQGYAWGYGIRYDNSPISPNISDNILTHMARAIFYDGASNADISDDVMAQL